MTCYLDTNVVMWLFTGTKLSPAATEAVNVAEDLRISPMVMVELQYLYEIKRVTYTPAAVFSELSRSLGLRQCNQSFIEVASMVRQQQWTRDPFDRFIAAQAATQDAYLVTRDQRIQRNYSKAVW